MCAPPPFHLVKIIGSPSAWKCIEDGNCFGQKLRNERVKTSQWKELEGDEQSSFSCIAVFTKVQWLKRFFLYCTEAISVPRVLHVVMSGWPVKHGCVFLVFWKKWLVQCCTCSVAYTGQVPGTRINTAMLNWSTCMLFNWQSQFLIFLKRDTLFCIIVVFDPGNIHAAVQGNQLFQDIMAFFKSLIFVFCKKGICKEPMYIWDLISN